MVNFFSLVGIGIAAFAATDIDDLFVLMLFFSHPKFAARQIVLGQYLGIMSLIALSATAYLFSLVVPPIVIGLMGLLPIAIGAKNLIELRKSRSEQHEKVDERRAVVEKRLQNTRPLMVQFLTVAGLTISNGGDNIGVYVPLFANSRGILEIATLAAIFLTITGVWCALAYYLVNHRLLANRFQRIGQLVFPFVLISLGLSILIEPFLR